ncbi:octopamine receptor Oamb-like [Teleopsis dalmanni]|uniref:octopamine receptor Oamb-like n=1 Tax=Teleopsis dalmanni TaxID=139649 RepID=UPI0018CECB50|nr:octopamine receptor Oamb-like [Teleopsis dalmanni]
MVRNGAPEVQHVCRKKVPSQPILATYTQGNNTLYYAVTTTKTTTSTATNNVQQQQQKYLQSTTITAAAAAAAAPAFNPYNPYDPAFSSLENESIAAATIAAINSTTNPATVNADSTAQTDFDNGDDMRSTITYKTYSPPPPCPWKCELTNDRGYVVYSALGSFYIPMFVMLYFYWRIYRAAVRTTRAINQGFKTTKGSGSESGNNRMDDSRLVLRIHRGRPCSTPQRTPLSVHSMSSTLSVNSNGDEATFPLQHNASHFNTPKRTTSMRVNRQRHEKIAIKVSYPSSENVLEMPASLPTSPPPCAMVTTASINHNKTPLHYNRRASFKSSLLEIGETTFNVDAANVHNQRDIDITDPKIANGSNILASSDYFSQFTRLFLEMKLFPN